MNWRWRWRLRIPYFIFCVWIDVGAGLWEFHISYSVYELTLVIYCQAQSAFSWAAGTYSCISHTHFISRITRTSHISYFINISFRARLNRRFNEQQEHILRLLREDEFKEVFCVWMNLKRRIIRGWIQRACYTWLNCMVYVDEFKEVCCICIHDVTVCCVCVHVCRRILCMYTRILRYAVYAYTYIEICCMCIHVYWGLLCMYTRIQRYTMCLYTYVQVCYICIHVYTGILCMYTRI